MCVCCKLVFPQTRHILVHIEPSEPDLKPRTLLWDTPHLTSMNIQRSNPINIARYGRARHKAHELEELSCLQQRTPEPNQSFSPNLGSPSPPESPDSTHRVSCIGNYLLLEPLEGDRVFRAVHLHSGEELVCKVKARVPRPNLSYTLTLHNVLKKMYKSLYLYAYYH